jgi:hypothetical protein
VKLYERALCNSHYADDIMQLGKRKQYWKFNHNPDVRDFFCSLLNLQTAKFNFFAMVFIELQVFLDISLCRQYIVTSCKRFSCCERGIRSTASTFITLINDQLDAQLFSMYLFQFPKCFEQPRAHHRENQLYQYNIWYMSPCVGDRFMYRSESSFPTCTWNGYRHRVTYTRCCIDTIDSPDDEHELARNM